MNKHDFDIALMEALESCMFEVVERKEQNGTVCVRLRNYYDEIILQLSQEGVIIFYHYSMNYFSYSDNLFVMGTYRGFEITNNGIITEFVNTTLGVSEYTSFIDDMFD